MVGQLFEVIVYGYDVVGCQIDVIQQVNGQIVFVMMCSYDVFGCLIEVVQSGSVVGVGVCVVMGYDVVGQVFSIDCYIGVSIIVLVMICNIWDVVGCVLEIKYVNGSGMVNDIVYQWDVVGCLVVIISSDGSMQYVYDVCGQFIGVDFSFQVDEFFGYDVNGNLIGFDILIGKVNCVLSDVCYSYIYDVEGNLVICIEMVIGIVICYIWDQCNCFVVMMIVNVQGQVIDSQSFKYDVFGCCIEQIEDVDGVGVGVVVMQYLMNDGSQIVLVLDNVGVVQQFFMYGDCVDQVLMECYGVIQIWLFVDYLGIVCDVIDVNGNFVDYLCYNVFGVIISQM